MNLSLLTPDFLRELIALTEKKQSLIAEIAKIDHSISNLSTGSPAPTKKSVAKKSKPAKAEKSTASAPATKAAKPRKQSKLKDRVLALLTEAGAEGIKVPDLAKKLAVKPGSLHVWFNTTGKKVVGLTRIAPGKYSLQPAVS